MTDDKRAPSDLHPSLTYDDAPAAIEWLCRAFGFHSWYFGNYRPGEYWET